jgi:hypothetical protein
MLSIEVSDLPDCFFELPDPQEIKTKKTGRIIKKYFCIILRFRLFQFKAPEVNGVLLVFRVKGTPVVLLFQCFNPV